MIRGIHHPSISTRDMDRLLPFYRDLLGFEIVGDWEMPKGRLDRIAALDGTRARIVLLRAGNAYLELFEYRSPQPRAIDSARRVCDPGITHVCLDVTDLDAEYTRLLAAGMTFHTPPERLGRAVRTTYGRDPDGNVIELQEILDPTVGFALRT